MQTAPSRGAESAAWPLTWAAAVLASFALWGSASAMGPGTVPSGPPREPSCRSPLDAKALGARGDGKTDDTLALQGAIDRAAAEGCALIVPEGTYLVRAEMTGGSPGWSHVTDTGGLKLPSGAHLMLATGATLKALPHGGYGGSVLRILGAQRVMVEGPGRILGDRGDHDYSDSRTPRVPDRTTHEWNSVISVRGGRDVVIRHLTVQDSTGDGITIGAMAPSDADTERVQVTGCRISGSRRNNISILGRSEDVLITQNWLDDAGVNDRTDASPRIAGVPPRAGIDVEGGYLADGTSPRRVVIVGNSFRGNWGPAISSYNASGVTIQGNVADSSIGYAYSTDVALTGNIVKEGPQSDPVHQARWSPDIAYRKGDKVREGEGTFVSTRDGNARQRPAAGAAAWMPYAPPGIYGTGVAGGVSQNRAVVSGNAVRGFSVGLDIRGAGVVVAGNMVSGQREAGIVAYELAAALIEGNQIDAAPWGVRVASGLDGVSVRGNQVSGASRAAIVNQVGGAVIGGNYVRLSSVGVEVRGGSATVTSNVIDMANMPPSAVGLVVRGTGTRAAILENTVRAPSGTAILVAQGGGVVRGNQVIDVSGDRPAILVDSAAAPPVLDNIVTQGPGTRGVVGVLVRGGVLGEVAGNRVLSSEGRLLPDAVRVDPVRGPGDPAAGARGEARRP